MPKDRVGKKMQCPNPDCRQLITIKPPKTGKVDWTDPNAKRPSAAKVEKLEGVVATGGENLDRKTLEEIGRQRKLEEQAYEEPGEARKRWLKRFAWLVVFGGVGWLGVSQYLKTRKDDKQQVNVAALVKAVDDAEDGKRPAAFKSAIRRGAAECRVRSASSKADRDEAVAYLHKGRVELAKVESPVDRSALLLELATTATTFGGESADVEAQKRLGWVEVQKEVRQTLADALSDPDFRAEAVRTVTRAFAQKNQPAIPSALFGVLVGEADRNEVLALVGLELVRHKQTDAAKESYKKIGVADAKAGGSLRALGSIVSEAKRAGAGRRAEAEAATLAGDAAAGRAIAAAPGDPYERFAALVAVAAAADDSAALDALAELLGKELENKELPTWQARRAARLAGQAGKADLAALLADGADAPARPWVRLDALRGRLARDPKAKVDPSWAADVGDAEKHPAAAIAHEEVARHAAAAGDKVNDNAFKGTVQPFGQLGTMLGTQDRSLAR